MSQSLSTIRLPEYWPDPKSTYTPTSVDEVIEILRDAESASQSIVPVGGCTKLTMGYAPSATRSYSVLSLQKFNRVQDYQPDDMTVTVDPGVTFAELQSLLQTRGQYLAIDPPFSTQATLGGIVATNSTGLWRSSHGAPRDLLIGAKTVMTGAKLIKAGGRVVKNVAGYDLCKLLTGSWGTVGVTTELTFKVKTLPEVRRCLTWTAPDIEAAVRVARRMYTNRLAVIYAFATKAAGTSATVLIGIEGLPARLDWQTDELNKIATSNGLSEMSVASQELVEQTRSSLFDKESPASAKLSCKPSDLEANTSQFAAVADSVSVDCGMGAIFASFSQSNIESIASITTKFSEDFQLSWQTLPLKFEDTISRWGETRGDFFLHQRVKELIDPKGTFSPGRFYGRL